MAHHLSDKQIRELWFWSLPSDQQLAYIGPVGDHRTIASLRQRGLLVSTPDGQDMTPSTEGWQVLLAVAEAGNPPWRT